MRWMVGATFVIAVLALGLHLRSPVVTPPPDESLGARLQRECASVIDTAGVQVIQLNVLDVLEEDRGLDQDLKKFPGLLEKIDYLKEKRPDRWKDGIKEATSRARAAWIVNCILQRGLRGAAQ